MSHTHASSVYRGFLTFFITLIFAAGSSASDKTPSALWKNLAAGKHQRLVLTGTSLSTNAYSYWPDSLLAALDARFPGGLLDIQNISPDGGNTSMAGPNCADSVSKVIALAPNAVFIEFASNDATNYVDCTVEGCSRPSHIKMIDAIRKSLPSCEIFLYVTGLPWDMQSCGSVSCAYCTVFEAQYCRRAARPSNNDHVEVYFDMVRQEADHYYTHLFDTYWAFKAIHDSAFSSYVNYLYDGHHPTPKAVHEIILPQMLQVLKGLPLAITEPRTGDTITIGDSVHVTWEYDPDSVGVVELQVSPDSGKDWLPAMNKSVQAADGGTAFLFPSEIGGMSLQTNQLLIRVSKYNSNLSDAVGPMVIRAASSSVHRQVVAAAPRHNSAVVKIMVVGNRADRLEIMENGHLFDIRGARLPALNHKLQ
jgi:GDSL-like Lipase/Acylhydrolase family